MCLNPIKIRVKSKRISQNNFQKIFITVPCGHCAECMQLKRDQWYLRNYWHCKEVFDKGGYVLFETLTYDDQNLPHLSDWFPELKNTDMDYSCFCYEHYRNFMKRLRINLTRGAFEPEYLEMKKLINERKRFKKGSKQYADLTYDIKCLNEIRKTFPVAENLQAFVVCEYGKEEWYRDDKGRMRKGTFRPHYHLLFYVTEKTLDSLTLSKYIYESWKHGRTDNCDLDGNVRVGYVRLKNCIGKNYSRNAEIELRKVSNYVAKYITKDNDYSKRIYNRVETITSNLFSNCIENLQENIDEFRKTGKPQSNFGMYGFYDSKTQKRLICDIIRRVDGFHLQGEGFGLYALEPENFDEELLINEGVFKMPDSMKLSKKIPAPMYYIRKLYYNYVKSPYADSGFYRLKPKGKEFYKNSLRRAYDSSVRRYVNLSLNLSKKDKIKFDELLTQSSLDDYVLYKMFLEDAMVPENRKYDLDTILQKKYEFARNPYGDYEYYNNNGVVYGPDLPFSNIEEKLVYECYIDDYYKGINDLFQVSSKESALVKVNLSNKLSALLDMDIDGFLCYSYDELFTFDMLPEFKIYKKFDSLFAPYIKAKAEESQYTFDNLEKLKKNYAKMFKNKI